MKLRRLAVLALPLLLAGCPEGGDRPAGANDRDTMTQRQRDSVTSTLAIPGAGAVGSAMDAVDAAGERASRHDSLVGGR